MNSQSQAWIQRRIERIDRTLKQRVSERLRRELQEERDRLERGLAPLHSIPITRIPTPKGNIRRLRDFDGPACLYCGGPLVDSACPNNRADWPHPPEM